MQSYLEYLILNIVLLKVFFNISSYQSYLEYRILSVVLLKVFFNMSSYQSYLEYLILSVVLLKVFFNMNSYQLSPSCARGRSSIWYQGDSCKIFSSFFKQGNVQKVPCDVRHWSLLYEQLHEDIKDTRGAPEFPLKYNIYRITLPGINSRLIIFDRIWCSSHDLILKLP